MELEWEIGKPLIMLTLLGDVDHDKSARSRINLLLSSFIQSSKYVDCDNEMRWPWIITNPLDQMGNEVGYIVRKINKKCNTVRDKECNIPIRCIGICTWGMIANREQIQCGDVDFHLSKVKGDKSKEERNALCSLNPSMSHYLFVDDGTNAVRGLDRYQQKLFAAYTEPRVCVISGGGDGTLENLKKCLHDNVPCIIVTGSGGVADKLAKIISQTCSLTKEGDIEVLLTLEEVPKKQRSLMLSCLEKRQNCYLWSPECSDFPDIQSFILRVVAESYFAEPKEVEDEKLNTYLKLCQYWAKPDVSKEAMAQVTKMKKQAILLDSVKYGQRKMVNFLLENCEKDLQDLDLLLVKDILKSCPATQQRIERFCKFERSGSLHMISSKLSTFLDMKDEDKAPDCFLDENAKNKPNSMNKALMFMFIWSVFKGDFDLADVLLRYLNHPLSSTLIAASILSSLSKLPNFEIQKATLLEAAQYFESKACEIVNFGYRINRWKASFLLLQDYGLGVSCLELSATNDYSHNFLVTPACQEFLTGIWEKGMKHQNARIPFMGIRKQSFWCLMVSLLALPACIALPVVLCYEDPSFLWWQRLLAILISFAVTASLLLILAIVFQLWPPSQSYFYERLDGHVTNDYKVFQDDLGLDFDKYESLSEELFEIGINPCHLQKKYHGSIWSGFNFVKELNRSPLIRFLHHTTSYITYLVYFAYLIINIETIGKTFHLEVLLFLFWISFMCDEIKQFFDCENRGNKLHEYFSSSWNKLDALIIIMKLVAMGLYIHYRVTGDQPPDRSLSNQVASLTDVTNSEKSTAFTKENMYTLFATIFVLDAIRILQSFLMGSIFGPILLMVGQMMRDLRNLLSIILVFLFTYGVTLLGVNYTVNPKLRGQGNLTALKIILNCPFYHLFGDHLTDMELCWPEKGQNQSVLVANFIPTLRGLYLLIAVILLLNLLVAMFNSSIQKVEQRSERLWYLYRRDIIFENWKRGTFPFAPYQLIGIVWSWISKCLPKCGNKPSQYFNKKMLSITVANNSGNSDKASEWFCTVSHWEQLVFNKICAQSDAMESENLQEQQIHKEHLLHQEALIAKFKDARQLTSHEIGQNFHNLEKSISTMILRKYERSNKNQEPDLMATSEKGTTMNLRESTEPSDQLLSHMFD